MGLEKENCHSRVVMDEEELCRTIAPILARKDPPVPVVGERDPQGVNAHVQVGFEDVIGEPPGTHSFDSVWVGSHALFELVKFGFYRVLTTLLAIPLAFVAGLAFALLSCLHIWVVMPVIHSYMTVLPSLRTLWQSLMTMFVAPLSQSIGRFLSGIRFQIQQA